MKKNLFWAFLALVIVLACAYAFGQATRSYTVNYTTTPPTCDGVVGSGEWSAAEPRQAQFRLLRTADPGTLATEDIGFQALCDDTNLYVLITTNDPDFSQSTQTAEDSLGLNDDTEIFWDPGSMAENIGGDTEDDSYQLRVPMITGVRAAGAPGPPYLAHAARYDNLFSGTEWNPTHVAVGITATAGAGVVEIALPFGDMNETYGAFYNSATSGETDLVVTGRPNKDDEWAFEVCRINGDGTLPLWNWHSGDGATAYFAEKPFGKITFNVPTPTPIPTPSPTPPGFAGARSEWSIYE